MRAFRLLALLFALLAPSLANAQFYSTGADPLSLHWSRLNRPLWSIDADTAARQWAALIDANLDSVAPLLYADFPATLRRRHVNVVVHSAAAYSNGLVSWAPKRLEAYAYDTGADDCVPWVSHLLTHEYRHVLQTQTTISGFSRFLYGLFGQQSVGLIAGLFVPKWALEGDAVWAETQYTPGGRGRNALFLQQTRALVVDGRTPSYSRAYFGSYARRVPDYYHLGYHLVSQVSDSLSNAVWGNALDCAGRLPFTFVPFHRSLRKQTGYRPMALYRKAMSDAKAKWISEFSSRHDTPSIPLWSSSNDYEEFLFAQPCHGGWVAYSESPSDIPHFSVRDSLGNELRRIVPYLRNEELFTVHGDTIVWSERRQHCRWSNASENCLMAASLSSGKSRRLTSGANYHSPSFSPDGLLLAAVLSAPNLSHSLTLLDSDGSPVRSLLTLPVGWQMPEVTWLAPNALAAIVLCPEGKGVMMVSTESSDAVWLLPPAFRNIRDLASAPAGLLFFSMDSCGYSDVYSLRLADGAVSRRFTSRHGVRAPHPVDETHIAVSSYSSTGYAPLIGLMEDSLCARASYRPVALPADTMSLDGFRRIGPMRVNLLPNVHSWGPVVVDANSATISPGLSVSSQNTHGTTWFQAGLNFGGDDDEIIFASATWDWLWPRFSFSGHWGHTDYLYQQTYKVKEVGKPDGVGEYIATVTVDGRAHNSDFTVSSSLPLTRNGGQWLRAITPSVSFRRQKTTGVNRHIVKVPTDGRDPIVYDSPTPDNRYFCTTFAISAHLLRRTAERDVGCRAGAALNVIFDAAPYENDYGCLLYANLRTYFPGFAQHHQFSLTLAAQRHFPGSVVSSQTGGYSYRRMIADRIPAPYGLTRRSALSSALFRAAYHLPLFNPDWQIGPVAYLKRINLRLIGDYGVDRLWNGTSAYATADRWTASAELWAESRLFLLPYPVNFGLRTSFLPSTSTITSALLFSVSFN